MSNVNRFQEFVCSCAANARLIEFDAKGKRVDIGRVIASPNVFRVFHPGFDPCGPFAPYHQFDFLDKLIFVRKDDEKALEKLGDGFLAFSTLLGTLADCDCSTGCSASSEGTAVYRMHPASKAPDRVVFERYEDDKAQWAVLPAEFEGKDGMVCSKFWIAKDPTLIFGHPGELTDEFEQARERSRGACKKIGIPGKIRRQRALAHVRNLRGTKCPRRFFPPEPIR